MFRGLDNYEKIVGFYLHYHLLSMIDLVFSNMCNMEECI